jgi:tetratricopeptide (TPR) repeat protein
MITAGLSYSKWETLGDSDDEASGDDESSKITYNEPDQLMGKGGQHYRNGRHVDAQQCFERVLLLPKVSEQQKIRCHLNIAAACIEIPDYSTAAMHSRAAFVSDRSNGRALQFLAYAVKRLDDPVLQAEYAADVDHVAALRDTAQERKAAGNDAFQAGEYSRAVQCYSGGLHACVDDSTRCILLSNRAECFIRIGIASDAAVAKTSVVAALDDCKSSLAIGASLLVHLNCR